MENIAGIVRHVRDGAVCEVVTSCVPTVKDSLSAHIIIYNFSSMEDLSQRFSNTFQWLEELQKKENWKNILQDFLFLAKECG